MTQLEELENDLQDNRKLLVECERENDAKRVMMQQKVIDAIERKIAELSDDSDDGMDYINLQLSQGMAVTYW
ncbi:hypothetical protein [Bacteroides hominis]|uniref:hypothetical protein n=1 Tax=Bacteroides hominis TaxID=2763023 RepID=UPI003D6B53B9